MLRDILSGEDPQVLAVLAVIRAAGADVLLLQGLDTDAGGATVEALAQALDAEGMAYPYRVTFPGNAGRPSGHDLDGDGRRDGPRDAHGYGYFTGQGGMAILSRLPIGTVRDFSALPWAALPGSIAATVTPAAALPDLRLHSVAAWDVELILPDGPFHLLASHASAPVFDGPEDRNGLRNAAELRFWRMYLDGWSPDGQPFAASRFALAGTFNVDPDRGEGRRDAIRALLDHPALQDPRPQRPDGGLRTVDWPEPTPGDLRVDYILPAAEITVLHGEVLWPVAGQEGLTIAVVEAASDHRLVVLDLDL
ncbi:3-phytase precursor [Roseibacterium elongatum DSM 19469]|uniref:3-phytase n=1 Tax=Roseicyclus elongatus DSM 19469 TaxID=1294273 RepID=W8S4A5_9RHOB|nr:endonuclease/exonuclease/phosphatase family protein [Roseibacterium elongatum]AHM03621.1 3-phytase precursor [Roseibacterium elongatum DSM 19469]